MMYEPYFTILVQQAYSILIEKPGYNAFYATRDAPKLADQILDEWCKEIVAYNDKD